jgi:beta-galactosidase
VGTRLSDDDLAALLAPILAPDPADAATGDPAVDPGDAAAGDPVGWPTGIERVVRRGPAASYEFLINHTGQPARIALARGGFELLAGAEVTGELELRPQGVVILRRPRE